MTKIEFWEKALTAAFRPAEVVVDADKSSVKVTVSSRGRHCAIRLPLAETEQPSLQLVIDRMRQAMAKDWLAST